VRLHTIIPGRNHEFELEADYQAGFILRRMGATREQAIAAYRIFPDAETLTHPGRAQRVQSVTLGWIDGGSTHGIASVSPGQPLPQQPAIPSVAPQQPQVPAGPKVSLHDSPNRPARSAPSSASGVCSGADVEVSGAGKRCLDPGDPSNRMFEDCFWSQGKRTCGPRMVMVPSGRFLMGSSDAEIEAAVKLYPKTKPEWFKRESPEHEVTIHRPFAVSETHVTRGQFAAFVTATGHKTDGGCLVWEKTEFQPKADRSWRNPGFDQDDSHPVVCVNWGDALAFTTWLSKETSANYRLITEAEAEYVIRGTSTPARQPRYFFGNETKNLCQYGNAADHVAAAKYNWDINAVAPCNDGYAATAPGGQYPANAFGIRDAHGNAGSLTQDCFTENYAAAPRDGSAVTHGNCEFRMIRGGSWNFSPEYVRSAYRDWLKVGLRIEKVGFRVVRKLAP
jgi:formylglycine-generating enzyme required for sulfatase activity